MATHTPIALLMRPFLQSFRFLTPTSKPTMRPKLQPALTKPTFQPTLPSPRPFSTSPPNNAGSSLRSQRKMKSSGGGGSGGRGRKRGGKGPDNRVTLIRYHMQHSVTPRPLRLSRMRSLRHWTIHRAWMLARRKKLENEEGELMSMYQSMHNACEALRQIGTPGTSEHGRLYRIAMEKKGIFGQGGIPIEYARYQVETPAKEVWNHEWTR